MKQPQVEPAGVPTSPARAGSPLFLIAICFIAAVGGLLFGFDTAVISGTVGFFKAEFGLSAAMTGWTAGSAIVGCMFGAGFAGPLSDRFGRKRLILLSAVFFGISAIGCGISRTVDHLIWARLLGGLGIGISSMVSPMYIAEVSPPHVRGRLVSLQQLTIVIGILAAFFSNQVVLHTSLSDPEKWRWMFGVGAFPALIFFLMALPLPESPRYLAKLGLMDQARATLARIAGDREANEEMVQISDAIQHEGGSFSDLLKPGLRRALFIGSTLAILQQISGINAIMYYAPEIFKQSGAAASSAYGDAVWVGAVNLLFTIISMTMVDRFGRKPLLLFGTTAMGISLLLVGLAFYRHTTGIWLLAMILAYVASFAVAMGTILWIVIAEIFPTRTRGRGMAFCTVCLWLACYAVSQTFPILLEKIGPAYTFWGYAAICAVTLIFVGACVPETKGRSLEEIERFWTAGRAGKS